MSHKASVPCPLCTGARARWCACMFVPVPQPAAAAPRPPLTAAAAPMPCDNNHTGGPMPAARAPRLGPGKGDGALSTRAASWRESCGTTQRQHYSSPPTAPVLVPGHQPAASTLPPPAAHAQPLSRAPPPRTQSHSAPSRTAKAASAPRGGRPPATNPSPAPTQSSASSAPRVTAAASATRCMSTGSTLTGGLVDRYYSNTVP